jgi:hypothetical protein
MLVHIECCSTTHHIIGFAAIAFCSMGTLSNVFHAADVTLGKGAEAPKLHDVHLAVSPFAKMPPENDGREMRSSKVIANRPGPTRT